MRYLICCVLLVAAGTTAASHAHAYAYGAPVTVTAVDRYGVPFPLYPVQHDSAPERQRAYLQAERGQRYALRVTNHTPERVGVVLAVDGRNVISGARSELSPTERMYVLGPWQSATYDGWRTGRDQVNAFYFTSEADSYALAFGDDTALGVIALAAYRERGGSRDFGNTRGQRRADSAPRAANGDSAAARAPAGEAAGLDDGAATGFGERHYSPSREVRFRPARRPLTRAFIKYAWSSTLCEIGVIRCGHNGNRFWPDEGAQRDGGFAPPPPGYRVGPHGGGNERRR